MSISDATNKVTYNGDASQTVFPFSFRILETSNLIVTLTDADGAETTLVLGTDYTVTAVNNDFTNGGSVTTQGGYSPPAATQTITIYRQIPLTQEVDYTENDAFPAETHEGALDKLTMIAQQQAEVIGRQIVVPLVEDGFQWPAAEDLANLYVVGSSGGGVHGVSGLDPNETLLGTDMTVTIPAGATEAEVRAAILAIPSNLNGHNVTISFTGGGADFTFASNFELEGADGPFYGGRLVISGSSSPVLDFAGQLDIFYTKAHITFMPMVAIELSTSSAYIFMKYCSTVTFLCNITSTATSKLSQLINIWETTVDFTLGTLTVGANGSVAGVKCSYGSTVYIVSTYTLSGSPDSWVEVTGGLAHINKDSVDFTYTVEEGGLLIDSVGRLISNDQTPISTGRTWTSRGGLGHSGALYFMQGLYRSGTWLIPILGNANIIQSTDLVTFTDRAHNSGGNTMRGVNWFPNTSEYVIFGDDGGTNGRIASSPDGITWTQETPTSTLKNIYGGWGDSSVFTLTGTDSGNTNWYVFTSPDLVTWTQRATTAYNGAGSVIGNSTEDVYVTGTNTTYAHASDPTGTWTTGVSLPSGMATVTAVFCYDDVFYMTGRTTTTSYPCFAYGTDGTTWTLVTNGDANKTPGAICVVGDYIFTFVELAAGGALQYCHLDFIDDAQAWHTVDHAALGLVDHQDCYLLVTDGDSKMLAGVVTAAAPMAMVSGLQ